MVEAGINIIRVGESVWSTWEPRDGEFDLDWLAPVLDAAHERGHLGDHRHPDLRRAAVAAAQVPGDHRAHRDRGASSRTATRQDIDYSHPGFRYLAERLIRKIVGTLLATIRR